MVNLIEEVQIKLAARDELYEVAVHLHNCWKAEYKGIVRDDFLDSMTIGERYMELQGRFDAGMTGYLIMRYCGELVGASVFGMSFTVGYPDDGEISAIYLRHDFIGKGFGHKLFAKTEEALADKGYRSYILDVLSDNSRAVKFYQKHGYETVDNRTVKLGNHEYPLTVLRKENKL